MINVNFLGLGSLAAKQQKGKTNGVVSAEPESGSTAGDADSGITEAAFPNVLMQMVLGQQIPPTVPIKTEQAAVPPEMLVDGEILVSEGPLYGGGQQLSLREQLFAGEMKKQSVVQRAESGIPVSTERSIVLDVPNTEISTVLLNGQNAESENNIQQVPKENVDSVLLDATANRTIGGMSINPLQVQSSIGQQTSKQSTAEGGDSSSAIPKQSGMMAGEANPENSTLQIPVSGSSGLSNKSISNVIQQTPSPQQNANRTNTASEIKQNAEPVKVILPKTTSNNSLDNNSKLGMNTIAVNELVPSGKSSTESPLGNRNQLMDKDFQIKEIRTSDSQPFVNAESLKSSLPDTQPVLRQNSSVRKQTANRSMGNEQTLTSISSNDLEHKGILSAVGTQGEKTSKIVSGESIVSDKISAPEKKSMDAVSVDSGKQENGVKNETQNPGNSTFTSKENYDRQNVPAKDSAAIDVRQGQQSFASIVEEKGTGIISKSQQPELSSILQRQETVNTIVEQLAKNVTVSLDENNSQMKISLKPEALGEVLLKVSIEQGKVSTQMEVQQPQVKAVIEANLQVLREALTSKGLVVDRIDISTTQYSLNERSSQHGQQRSNLKNYFGKEIDDDITEQTKLFGYNTVDYVA